MNWGGVYLTVFMEPPKAGDILFLNQDNFLKGWWKVQLVYMRVFEARDCSSGIEITTNKAKHCAVLAAMADPIDV